MKILLSGACGHMGAEVLKLSKTGFRGAEIVAGVDANAGADCSVPCASSFAEAEKNVDCVVDFSHHSATKALTDFAVANNLPLVIATTGQTEDEKAMIAEAGKKIPVFFAANFSLGIALLTDLAKKAAATMGDAEIEIVEKHHDRKIDAPSGTALSLAKAIQSVRPETYNVCGRSGQSKRTKEEIGIHSVRMGNIVGEHEVIIGTENENITLKHEAHSRGVFAEGALFAADFIVKQPVGLYSMEELLKG